MDTFIQKRYRWEDGNHISTKWPFLVLSSTPLFLYGSASPPHSLYTSLSCGTRSWDSTRWLYSCDKISYTRSDYSQCDVDLITVNVDSLKCAEQNISQLYIHVSFCFKVIRLWLNLPTGGHSHVICMVKYAITPSHLLIQ